MEQKQYCSKFSKDFKNGPDQNNLNKTKLKDMANELNDRIKMTFI